MYLKMKWIAIFMLVLVVSLCGQDNVSILLSGNRLTISSDGRFLLNGDILEEDAYLLAKTKARYGSIVSAVNYIVKKNIINPAFKDTDEGNALCIGNITVLEETPNKVFADGHQQLTLNLVLALDLNTLQQDIIEIRKQPWLLKTYEIENNRIKLLNQMLLSVESSRESLDFQKLQNLIKQSRASEWVFEGLETRNYAAQIQDFDQAIVLNPDYAFARYLRAKAYYRIKAYEKSVEDYNWLITHYPDWIEIYYLRSLPNGYIENYDKVIEDCNHMISEQPDFLPALVNRGIAYSKTDQLDAAMADYQKSLSIDPTHTVVHYNMGCIYALRGDSQAALTSIESALKNGFSDFDELLKDKDLESLRDTTQFQALIEKYRKTGLQ